MPPGDTATATELRRRWNRTGTSRRTIVARRRTSLQSGISPQGENRGQVTHETVVSRSVGEAVGMCSRSRHYDRAHLQSPSARGRDPRRRHAEPPVRWRRAPEHWTADYAGDAIIERPPGRRGDVPESGRSFAATARASSQSSPARPAAQTAPSSCSRSSPRPIRRSSGSTRRSVVRPGQPSPPPRRTARPIRSSRSTSTCTRSSCWTIPSGSSPIRRAS